MKKLLLAASVAVLATSSALPALANQDKCEEGRAALLMKVNSEFDPAIAETEKLIQDMRAKNQNPEDIAYKIDGQFISLAAFYEKLKVDRGAVTAAVNTEADDCNKSLEPLQKAMNAYVNGITGGVASILPGKMGYVDVSQILAGYPLGGPNALIPHFRTQVFNALNMGPGNDLRKFIENPLGGENAVLRKLFG